VCGRPVKPNWRGRVLYEGLTEPGGTGWLWGPHPIHDGCRRELETGFEEGIEQGRYLRRTLRRPSPLGR